MGITSRVWVSVAVISLSLPTFAETQLSDLFKCSNAFYQASNDWLYLNPTAGGSSPIKKWEQKKMWFEHPSMDLFLIPNQDKPTEVTLIYKDQIYNVTMDANELATVLDNSKQKYLDHYGLDLLLPDNQRIKVGVRNIDLVEHARLNDVDQRIREYARKGILINRSAELMVWANHPQGMTFVSAATEPASREQIYFAKTYVEKFLDLYVVYATRGVYTDLFYLVDHAQRIPPTVKIMENDIKKMEVELEVLPGIIEVESAKVSKYENLLKTTEDETVRELVTKALNEAKPKLEAALEKYTENKASIDAQKEQIAALTQAYSELPHTLNTLVSKKSEVINKTLSALQACAPIASLNDHIAEQLESLIKYSQNPNENLRSVGI